MKYCEICKKFFNEIGYYNHMKMKHNILSIYNKSKTNPNLKYDYFDTINSLEKAYWLGYLYADGYVSSHKGRIVLTTCEKDIEILENFCSVLIIEKNKIKKRIHGKGYTSFSLTIDNLNMYNALIKYGCLNKKSLIIRLPHLDSNDYYLSFLLGYYDGDGFTKGSNICSGSKEFLNDIKNKYNIDYDVKQKNENLYYLTLGIKLKRKIMGIYEFSLKRKRIKIIPNDDEKILKNGKLINISILQKNKKFEINKDELINFLKKYPLEQIGKMFNVTGNSIKKRAIKLKIDKNLIIKGRGYWTKQKIIKS